MFNRDSEKIAGELANLARNEAALMRGDTIVPFPKLMMEGAASVSINVFQPKRND